MSLRPGAAPRLHPAASGAAAHLLMGKALADQGRTAQALRELDRAMAIDPDLIEAYLVAGEIRHRLRDNAAAKAAYHRVLEQTSGHAAAHYGLGVVLHQEKEYEEARVHLERALRMESHAQASALLARTLRSLGRPAEAVPVLRKALERAKDDAILWLELGEAYFETARDAEAAEALGRALRSSPRLAAARLRLGDLALRQGRLDAAILEYEKAIMADPILPGAHARLGRAQEQAGRTALAAAAFEVEMLVNPDTGKEP